MRTLLLGATGLVGREILALLLRDERVETVRALVRRRTGVTSPKLDEQVVDLDAMERRPELFAVDAIFCGLGTTIKVSGSQERFRVVDHDYPLRAAKLGHEAGARQYLLVSALGASEHSRVFYNRVKGETERDIRELRYESTTIARPSLLLGDRPEFRLGEVVFSRFGWLMPPAYRPIHAREVARALVAASHEARPGVRILESREMRRAPQA